MMRFCLAVMAVTVLGGCSTTPPAPDAEDLRGPLVRVGDDLAPHVGRQIRVIAEVSHTKWASFGEYWLTVPNLGGHQGDLVHAWGTVTREQDRIPRSPDGAIAQGREGTYYYLHHCEFDVLEDK